MLSDALGYLRVATARLLADPDEQAASLAMKALTAQAVLEELDVEPTYIGTAISASDALAEAARAIAAARSDVPPAAWVLICELDDLLGQ